MKITILQGAFLPVPPLRGGAVEKVWLALGQEFARLGHEVVHVSRLCDTLPSTEIDEGVRHVRIRGYDAPANLALLKLCDLLYTWRAKSVIEKSDIVITNTFWAPIILSPKKQGPLWVHVARYPKGQMRFYKKALRLQTVSRVISDAMIEQTPGLADKVCIIPNPLPPFRTPAQPVERQIKKVLFVGRVHPEKGLDLLIDAALLAVQRDPSLRFEVVGPWEEKYGGGGTAYFQSVQERAKPLGEKLSFTGAIFDQGLLHKKYLEAGLFVYPSLAAKGEASPVAPLEAMAAGCPVVTTNLKCFEDLLGTSAFAHRFDHESPTAPELFAQKILSVTAPASNWEEQSHCAVSRSRDFSPELVAAEYLRTMSQALASR